MNNTAPSLRLDSDWAPAADGGMLTLRLTNSSALPLSNFRLAFTSLFPLLTGDQLEGARLVERISNYQVIAPQLDFVLAPGTSWQISGHLSHTIRHYTSAVKSAYVIRDDGRLMAVDAAATTQNGGSGVPRLDLPLPAPLPAGATSVAVLPYPLGIEVAGSRRVGGSALRFAQGPPAAERAFAAAAGLADRLFPSEPPLFARDGAIVCAAQRADFADEAYRLDFAPDAATLTASGSTGFFYGLVTLGQMLRGARHMPGRFAFPSAGKVVDRPRFAWRGMLLDVARQVFSLDDLLRLIDCLAWHKLNRFHLHLSDDEGWRLDIPEYPQLAERAGWRGHGLPLPPLLGSPAERYGMVYSRPDIARLTQRAAQLAITIIPEIEMPGHSCAVLQAMPELRDRSDTGTHRNVLNPAVPLTYEVLAAILDEVARLFPSPWIHVGADEVPWDAWLSSPRAQALMEGNGWRENERLQSYFLRRIQEIIRGLGRRTGAWEEAALGDGIDRQDSYLVAWRTSGVALAEQGYDVVLAPGDAYYLDMAQSDDWWEPGMDWAGAVSLQRCYAYDPGAEWPAALEPRLIGVQACLWGEHLHDRRLFGRLTTPRLSAVAESAWSPPTAKDVRRFMAVSGLMPTPDIR